MDFVTGPFSDDIMSDLIKHGVSLWFWPTPWSFRWIEEIVSASRQKEINKAATQADAASFQSNLNDVLKNS